MHSTFQHGVTLAILTILLQFACAKQKSGITGKFYSRQQQKSRYGEISKITAGLVRKQGFRLCLRGGKAPLTILDKVRDSINDIDDSAIDQYCSINSTALDEFCASLNPTQILRIANSRFQLPLIFDDLSQEINFHALRHALNFGSGWHETVMPERGEKGKPHRDSVLHGLIQLHMEGGKLGEADHLSSLKLFPLSQAFNIPITQEERLDGGPIRKDVPSDFRRLIDSYYDTISQLGAELLARGFKSIADFILSTELHGHGGADHTTPQEQFTADRLVARLTSCFECFRDEVTRTSSHRRAPRPGAQPLRRWRPVPCSRPAGLLPAGPLPCAGRPIHTLAPAGGQRSRWPRAVCLWQRLATSLWRMIPLESPREDC